ncbi:hypothetical protein A8F94_13610 [Bacillus sp. FJAT-27225]|uniref:DUF421 domain-containing protein n=1 Tax=Bacillus sp. FJAT-27225 TaxID=1743144 RepID=UPI00080C2D93|nr:DUF421 domain-containing protein [Bacillus sp. FJAT-27225]OCA85887.1 hypothetical protein A8F94_13610 [Bacillus sp. FJAT-27225]
MEGMLVPVTRTAVSFIVLVLVTLVVGKHINTHKNHYSFALSITIGSFIANMSFDIKLKFSETVISFFVLILMFYICMVLSSRSRQIRKWLSGRPTVLIENGKILDKNMKKVKFSIDDLNQLLREKGIFNTFEVAYAILEVSGDLSVLKKNPFQNVSKQDLHVPNSSERLPIELIMDGEIIAKNSTGLYNRNWIEAECKNRNLRVEEIYYAVVNSHGNLFVDKYEDNLIAPTDVE